MWSKKLYLSGINSQNKIFYTEEEIVEKSLIQI